MLIAAYMVVGFGLASIYAIGMLRGRRERRHRLGLLIPLTVGCLLAPVQIFVGDVAARGVADHQPSKFAAFECIEETGPDQTEYIGGICTDDGVKYGIGIPGLDSWLVGFSTDTVVTGLDQIPDDEEPPANTLLHLAFDAMVGIGFGLLALGGWLAWSWRKRRDIPDGRAGKWFLRAVSVSGIGAVVAMESGWIVTEVGRQPWIVYEVMRTEEAVTGAGGLWFWFGGAVLLYAVLGDGRGEGAADHRPPGSGQRVRAGRRPPLRADRRPRRNGSRREHGRRRRRDPRRRSDALRDLRRRRLRRGRLAAALRTRPRREPAGAGARADLAFPRSRLGGQPRLADLHARGPLDRLPERVRGDHGDRSTCRWRWPSSGSSCAARASRSGTSSREPRVGAPPRSFAVSSVITPFFMGCVVGAIAAGEVEAGGSGDAFGWIGPLPIAVGILFVVACAYLAAVFLLDDCRRAGDAELCAYFERRATVTAVLAGAIALATLVVLRADGRYVFDGLFDEALPFVIASVVLGAFTLAGLVRGWSRALRPLAVGAVAMLIAGWAVAQFPYLLPETLTVEDAAAADPTLTAVIVVFGFAVAIVGPSLALLFWLAQKQALE